MKMCKVHWDELREKIRERGLYGLVATSGEQAVAQLVDGLENGPKKTNFDPLMAAHNQLVSNAVNVAGLALMMMNEDGTERCPVCYLVEKCPCGKGADCPFTTWLTKAADGAREYAIQLGLVGTDERTVQPSSKSHGKDNGE